MVLDYIVEAWESVVEFIGGLFENMGEFSPTGAVLGLVSAGLVFILRGQMLTPFLSHMGAVEKVIWGGLTYIGCGMAGYFIGMKMEE